MKNLIIALSLFFALGANAQAKKTAPAKPAAAKPVVASRIPNDEAAKKNVADLSNFITLTDERKAVFQELFTTKYRMLLNNGELSAERKVYVSQIIERKIEASLDAETFQKVKANTVLFQSLIN